MEVCKRVVLEFTPEEIKLLVYGAVSRDLKERLTEIAYYIDDKERAIATSGTIEIQKRIDKLYPKVEKSLIKSKGHAS